MIKILFACLLAGVTVSMLPGQTPICQARQFSSGQTVSIAGIVLNGPELGETRFIQDETGGIALYPGTGSIPGLETLQPGDLVLATGEIDEFQGLRELSPVEDFTVLATGQPLPEPLTLLPSEAGEFQEGELVRIPCATFVESGLFSGNKTYTLAGPDGDFINVYLNSNHPLAGQAIPAGNIDLTGILSEYDGEYQVLPRGGFDLEASSCLLFSQPIRALTIQTNAIQLSWNTNQPATGWVEYGPTPSLGQQTNPTGPTAEHQAWINALAPASFIYARAVSQVGAAVEIGPMEVFATASLSEGEIEAYFNHTYNSGLSTGSFPASGTPDDLYQAILDRIAAAQYTIDVAMYNNNMDEWADALEAAQQSGVQVRYVYDSGNANTGLNPLPSFPVFGHPEGDALMHHKFLIIDAEYPSLATVITGSMNFTDNSIFEDYNHMLFIQDQTLTLTFTREFEQMWGTSGPLPDQDLARFGCAKSPNTPRQLQIGQTPVELFFTPIDPVLPALESEILATAEYLDFSLFLITKDELSNALGNIHASGKQVRGIIDDIYASGSDFDYLVSLGIPMKPHPWDPIVHHKFAAADGEVVITGSYNWTSRATEENDENLLILRNAEIANWFDQAFDALWEVYTGSEGRVSQTTQVRLYPNPAGREPVWADYNQPPDRIRVFDLLGRQILDILPEADQTEIGPLAAGLYQVAFFYGSQILNQQLLLGSY